MMIFQSFTGEINKSDAIKQGVIMKGVSGEYKVLLDSGQQITAKPRGLLRKNGLIPSPGDRVCIMRCKKPGNLHMIDKILPRKSYFVRPTIANMDLMIITSSVKDPEADLYLTDKLIIICIHENVEPVLCITKADLFPDGVNAIMRQYELAKIPVFVLGITDDYCDNIVRLEERIRGKMISFAGQSGTGKSTLLNRILRKDHMEIGTISLKSHKGRHTTRHAELFAYNHGFIADTPGFLSLDLSEIGLSGEDIEKGYPEIYKQRDQCRFAGCKHTGEKGCAVSEENVEPERLRRYRAFRNEADAMNTNYNTKKRIGGKQND
jgi:ribosome biogenesis GTPase / thiamine phosphate phosphatase